MKGLRAAIGLAILATMAVHGADAGQAPGLASDPDIPISHRDRVYAAEQFSNTVSVTDPADNTLLGVIRRGDPIRQVVQGEDHTPRRYLVIAPGTPSQHEAPVQVQTD